MSDFDGSTEYLNVHVRAYANRLYHQERWRILERRENSVKALSVVLGTAAFAEIKGILPNGEVPLLPFFVFAFVVANAVSLVFQWGSKARDSAKRSAEWTQLEKDLEKVGPRKADDEKVTAWNARAAEIEAGEPAINQHLMWRSINRACVALGAEQEQQAKGWDYIRQNWVRPWPRAIP